MSAQSTAQIVGQIFAFLPKITAFESGQPVELDLPSASYDLEVPNFGKIRVSESGAKLTIQKV